VFLEEFEHGGRPVFFVAPEEIGGLLAELVQKGVAELAVVLREWGGGAGGAGFAI
jgi:hypothetical protein